MNASKRKYYQSDKFLRSPKWLAMRERVFTYWGRKCMKGGNCSGPLQVDHIKPRITHPHLAVRFSNCQPMCKKHNHEKGWKSRRDYRPKWKRFKYWLFG